MRLQIAFALRLTARLAGIALATGCALLLTAAVGCSEDERMPIGVPPPAARYCDGLHYTLRDDRCVFPDGTSCEEWAFYFGTCGQAHSACNLHGGMISSVTADLGTSTAVYALCTTPSGASCDEEAFWRTAMCP